MGAPFASRGISLRRCPPPGLRGLRKGPEGEQMQRETGGAGDFTPNDGPMRRQGLQSNEWAAPMTGESGPSSHQSRPR